MKEPKRNSDTYTEIENFKDYELTNCIAFEMAIRTKEFLECKDMLCKDRENKIALEKLSELGFKNSTEVLNYICECSRTMFISGYIWTVQVPNILINQNQGTIVTQASNQINIYEDEIMDPEARKSLQEYKREEFNKDIQSSIIMIYARPVMQLKNHKYFNYNFNISLSEKELLAQVKQIKSEYSKENTNMKTFLEIYHENNIDDKNHVNHNKCNIAKVFADMFFTYDYMKYAEDMLRKIEIDFDKKKLDLLEKYDEDTQDASYIDELDLDTQEYKEEKQKFDKKSSLLNVEHIITSTKKTRPNVVERYPTIMQKYIDKLDYMSFSAS